MTDKEKVVRLNRKIKQEQSKPHPDGYKIRGWFKEIREIKGEGWVPGHGHYHGGPNKLDLYQKEKQKPRPPHDRDDYKRLGDFLGRAQTGELYGDEAVDLLKDCAEAIRWARHGRGRKSQALRLGIIAGVPVAKLEREFKISFQAIYEQTSDFRSKMKRRPIVTAACAADWDILSLVNKQMSSA
jgi:hypothetical protein